MTRGRHRNKWVRKSLHLFVSFNTTTHPPFFNSHICFNISDLLTECRRMGNEAQEKINAAIQAKQTDNSAS